METFASKFRKPSSQKSHYYVNEFTANHACKNAEMNLRSKTTTANRLSSQIINRPFYSCGLSVLAFA